MLQAEGCVKRYQRSDTEKKKLVALRRPVYGKRYPTSVSQLSKGIALVPLRVSCSRPADDSSQGIVEDDV